MKIIFGLIMLCCMGCSAVGPDFTKPLRIDAIDTWDSSKNTCRFFFKSNMIADNRVLFPCDLAVVGQYIMIKNGELIVLNEKDISNEK